MRLIGVRSRLLALVVLLMASGCADKEPLGYCGRPFPTPSPGTSQAATVEVKGGEVVSEFPEGIRDFFVMPQRTPRPLPNGAYQREPYLAGVADGQYTATFVTFPVSGVSHHGVRMLVAGRSVVLDGPRFCA